MASLPRYTTLLIGRRTYAAELVQLVRLIRDERTDEYLEHGREPRFPTFEAAKAFAEQGHPVEWWPSPGGGDGEPKCFICGAFNAHPEAPQRHPRRVCAVCTDEAVDEDGKRVEFFNTALLGTGCGGRYVDTKERYDGATCYIRGRRCRASEARFGGIVIEVDEDGEDRGV